MNTNRVAIDDPTTPSAGRGKSSRCAPRCLHGAADRSAAGAQRAGARGRQPERLSDRCRAEIPPRQSWTGRRRRGRAWYSAVATFVSLSSGRHAPATPVRRARLRMFRARAQLPMPAPVTARPMAVPPAGLPMAGEPLGHGWLQPMPPGMMPLRRACRRRLRQCWSMTAALRRRQR